MTKKEWCSLKKGDIIYSVESGKVRQVIDDATKNGCVRLKPMKRCKYDNDYTVYSRQEARLFSKFILK